MTRDTEDKMKEGRLLLIMLQVEQLEDLQLLQDLPVQSLTIKILFPLHQR